MFGRAPPWLDEISLRGPRVYDTTQNCLKKLNLTLSLTPLAATRLGAMWHERKGSERTDIVRFARKALCQELKFIWVSNTRSLRDFGGDER
jgi:hypothetical protein